MIFQYHALRGGRLDHEHHDMSEQRETATAAMQQAIPGFDGGYRPIRRRSGQAPAGRKIYSFSQKHSQRECFCEKDRSRTTLPLANRASTWANVQFVSPLRHAYK
jgi:hypothetical protein